MFLFLPLCDFLPVLFYVSFLIPSPLLLLEESLAPSSLRSSTWENIRWEQEPGTRLGWSRLGSAVLLVNTRSVPEWLAFVGLHSLGDLECRDKSCSGGGRSLDETRNTLRVGGSTESLGEGRRSPPFILMGGEITFRSGKRNEIFRNQIVERIL
ncbi:hypothetical protein E2C01_043423 [Portunus trituberculatus]|uniref:Uncharacterized protein n=1 Tax=Portunus trituberculatus TaxID=210409 RepID=A0A5B7FWD4_PORTR|nr:hypothetical protein [Portunus trituberculatus]